MSASEANNVQALSERSSLLYVFCFNIQQTQHIGLCMANPLQIYCVSTANGEKHWFETYEEAIACEIELRKKKLNPTMQSYFALSSDDYWKLIEPMRNVNIDTYKIRFLEKYASNGNNTTYLNNAIKVAVQRNILYASNLQINYKEPIKELWRFALTNLTDKYKLEVSLSQYFDDVIYLKDFMNKQFIKEGYFAKDGFKISHAQKSLSVYLKYLWCTDAIVEPPTCPIDAIVLRKASINNVTWTTMNHINELIEVTNQVKELANSQSKTLAKWELLVF